MLIPDQIYSTSVSIKITEEIDNVIPKGEDGYHFYYLNEKNEQIIMDHILPVFKDKLDKAGIDLDISPENFTNWECIKIDISGDVAVKLIDSESFEDIFGRIVQDDMYNLSGENVLKGRVK